MGKKRKFETNNEEKEGFFCPACGQKCLRWPVFSKHLQRCCPDLLADKELLCDEKADQQPSNVTSNVTEALRQAGVEEQALRQQCVSQQPLSAKKVSS
jgi:hypothetical protein